MARSVSATSSPAAERRPDEQLIRTCDLVDRAADMGLQVVPRDEADASSPVLLPAMHYHQESRRLEAGDVLVVYTDGLVESWKASPS